MRSWALVCDVYFLEPQTRQPGETAALFAERVQRLIADKGRLKIAPWDGYLKYYNLGEKVRGGVRGGDGGGWWWWCGGRGGGGEGCMHDASGEPARLQDRSHFGSCSPPNSSTCSTPT